MPTVIDSFFVTLGLDPREYNKGRAQNRADVAKWKKEVADAEAQIASIRANSTKATKADDAKQIQSLREVLRSKKASIGEAEKLQKQEIARNKELAEGVGKVKDQVLGLLAVFGLGVGLKDFVQQTITGNAAIGRMAENLGLTTEALSTWQLAVSEIGGSADDATNSIQALVQTLQDISLRGDTSKLGDLQGLGLSVTDLQNPTEALLKMADAKERLHMSNAEFANRAGALGITPNMINLIERGRGAVERYLDSAAKTYAVHREDAEAAAELQTQLKLLTASYSRLGATYLLDVAPTLISFATWSRDNAPTVEGAFLGIGAAIVIMNGAAIAAAAPIATIVGLFALAGAAIAAAIKNQEEWNKLTAGEKATQTRAAGVALSGQRNEGNLIQHPPAPAASTAAVAAGGGAIRNPSAIAKYFEDHGVKPDVARGVAAGISAESRGDPTAFNRAGGGNGAYGIGQWRGARQKALFDRYGPKPGLAAQLEFMLWELKGGDKGGADVLAQNTSAAALFAYITKFMRPAVGKDTTGDLRRGTAALASLRGGAGVGAPALAGGSQTDVSIGTINIQTQASDPKAIAKTIGPAIKQNSFVANANTGLF